MATDVHETSFSTRSLKSVLAMYRKFEMRDSLFCTANNWEDTLTTLSEELECFGIMPIFFDKDDLQSLKSLREVIVDLINAFWKFIHKHRTLMKTHSQLEEVHSRILNDNNNLKNQIKRLKEDLCKKEELISQAREKERRLKVKCDSLTRELKHEKDEVLKLQKQLHSKDNQHQHELRRITQNGQKLREQLHKTIGTPVVKNNNGFKNNNVHHEKEIRLHKETIRRLEENNRQLLEEVNHLKETLSLHVAGVNLQMEASGIWDNIET